METGSRLGALLRISAVLFSLLATVPPLAAQCTEGCRVLLELVGETPGDQFGWVANSLGDITGDGIHDLVVTAATSSAGGTNSGRIYVYSGADGSELFRVTGGAGWNLGFDADGVGDLDGDEVRDLAIGAPSVSTGRVLLVSGADGSAIDVLLGEVGGDRFGAIVDDAGDVDGDGWSDIVATAPNHDPGGIADAGRAYLYSGADLGLLCIMDGDAAGDNFGSSASTAGDVDGDGGAEVVVGAPSAGPSQTGRSYLYTYDSGSCERIRTFEPDGPAVQFGQFFADGGRDVDRDGVPDHYVADFNANLAHVISGATGDSLYALDGNGERGGFGIGRIIDDVNGDGYADLVLAAWISNQGEIRAGKAFVYSGRDGSIMETFTHDRFNANFGFDADGMGDVDGDGMTDYLVTAATDLGSTGTTWVLAGTVPFAQAPRRPAGRRAP